MKKPKVIDLDANATTRIHPQVAETVARIEAEIWGNPSSSNVLGELARAEVETARTSVANLIGADSDEIVFTSGATEAINLAIRGLVALRREQKLHIVTSQVEHSAVLRVLDYLRRSRGVEITALAPNSWGRIEPSQVRKALRDETVLVCLLHGNNEIGSINPVTEIGELLREHPAHFFVDAPQTLGYQPPDVHTACIDLLSMSAHKMHGPKGIGALYVEQGVRLEPILIGGGQEGGLSSGTLNVAGIAGLGKAAELTLAEGEERSGKVSALRQRFLDRLRHRVPDTRLNGHPEDRLPGNLSLTIPYTPVDILQRRLPHLAFSRGSACTASSGQPSHVLRALGLSTQETDWTLRIGLSISNSQEEIDIAADDISNTVMALRGESVVYPSK